MGQAKSRGSKQERVAEGIRKQLEHQRLCKQRAAQIEASLTPEERENRKRTKMWMALAMGLSIGNL